jgi:hypothetical protein
VGCGKADPRPKNAKELRDRGWTVWSKRGGGFPDKIVAEFRQDGSGSLSWLIGNFAESWHFSYALDDGKIISLSAINAIGISYEGRGKAEVTQDGRLHFQMVLTGRKDGHDFKKREFDYILDFEEQSKSR